MATNAVYSYSGDTIDYTPTVAVNAGDIIDLGDFVGIARFPIAANALGTLGVTGVFDIIKSGTAGPVFAVGEPVFFDTTNNLASKSGGILVGICFLAASATDTFVRTKINSAGAPAAGVESRVVEDVDLTSASKVLDKEDVGKVMNVNPGSATNVVTLPATFAGGQYTIRCGADGQRVAVSPAAVDKFMGANLTGLDNKDRILAAATAQSGDFISITGDGVDGWFITAEQGTWTQEP